MTKDSGQRVRSHPRRHLLAASGEATAALHERLADLEAELARSQMMGRAAAIERDALLSSFSWQVMSPFRRITGVVRKLLNLRARAPERLVSPQPELESNIGYDRWLRDYHNLSEADRGAITAHINRFAETPLISIIIPVDREAEQLILKTVSSINGQLYPRWEICFIGESSSFDRIRQSTTDLICDQAKIRWIAQKEGHLDGQVTGAIKVALTQAAGAFVALMGLGDRLSEEALYEVAVTLIDYPATDLVYTDEDCVNEAGYRFAPALKPNWNIDLLLGQNLVGRLAVYRQSLLQKAIKTSGPGEHDLALAVALISHASRIQHIPAVLYHRYASKSDTPPLFGHARPPTWAEAQLRASQAYLAAQGESYTDAGSAQIVEWPGEPTRLQIRWPLPDPPPRVSLIIPTRDNSALLEQCVTGLLYRTDYSNIELLIVDNDSQDVATLGLLSRLQQDRRVRILPYRATFNYAAINNMAVGEASGDVIVLINDDIVVIEEDWLREMVSVALRPDVGAVGAKLFYGDGHIQHAGVILGVGEHTGRGGIAGHFGHGAEGDDPGYLDQYALAREVSAVTAACMAMRRDVFTAVGGFDAEHLPIAYNDVDLCLRIRELGLRILWTPFAALFHLESQSRGRDVTAEQIARAAREAEYMRDRWDRELNCDPFYNPNFDVQTPMHRLAHPPRRIKPWRNQSN